MDLMRLADRLRRIAREMESFIGPPEMAPCPDADDLMDAARALDAFAAAISSGEPQVDEPAYQQVWVQNLIGFINGRFPADEKWKAIFLERLAAIAPAPPRI